MTQQQNILRKRIIRMLAFVRRKFNYNPFNFLPTFSTIHHNKRKIEEKPKHDPLTSLIKKFVRYAVFLNESK